MNHPVSDLMSDSVAKIREMVDANTVIGDPIVTPQGMMLIPVSKISCGYAGGGTDFVTKNSGNTNPFGGGAGCSVKITPVAFLVVKGECVRLMPVTETPTTGLDHLFEILPDVVDKLASLVREKLEERKEKKEKETEK